MVVHLTQANDIVQRSCYKPRQQVVVFYCHTCSFFPSSLLLLRKQAGSRRRRVKWWEGGQVEQKNDRGENNPNIEYTHMEATSSVLACSSFPWLPVLPLPDCNLTISCKGYFVFFLLGSKMFLLCSLFFIEQFNFYFISFFYLKRDIPIQREREGTCASVSVCAWLKGKLLYAIYYRNM